MKIRVIERKYQEEWEDAGFSINVDREEIVEIDINTRAFASLLKKYEIKIQKKPRTSTEKKTSRKIKRSKPKSFSKKRKATKSKRKRTLIEIDDSDEENLDPQYNKKRKLQSGVEKV